MADSSHAKSKNKILFKAKTPARLTFKLDEPSTDRNDVIVFNPFLVASVDTRRDNHPAAACVRKDSAQVCS